MRDWPYDEDQGQLEEQWQTEEDERKLERLQDRIQGIYQVIIQDKDTYVNNAEAASIAADIVAIIDAEAKKRMSL